MLLAIDVGNTQTSFGVFENKKLIHHWRLETRSHRSAEEYASFFLPLCSQFGLGTASWEVVLVSVVPATDNAIEVFCEAFLKGPFLKIDSSLDLGIKIHTDVPQEVGADRLVNSAYAAEHLTLPAIVVDLGTATTFDVVGKERAYEGGIILPGVRLGLTALSTHTAKLPPINVSFSGPLIGKNTSACIQSGVQFGYLDMIEGLLLRLQNEMGPCEIALTGGLSSLFHSRLTLSAKLLMNLTLEGAELVYRRNR